MQIEFLLAFGLLALGIYLVWCAYQIQFKDRIDLVQFGTRPLPGVALLKRKFAALHAVHGLTCVATGVIMFITESISPSLWVFAGVSCALAVRRQLLIRAIEMNASKGVAE
jgi:hypothetical protein